MMRLMRSMRTPDKGGLAHSGFRAVAILGAGAVLSCSSGAASPSGPTCVTHAPESVFAAIASRIGRICS